LRINQFNYINHQHLPLLGQLGSLSDQFGALPDQLPQHIKDLLQTVGRRTAEKEKMSELLIEICKWKPSTLKELSQIVQRNEKYLLENFVTPLRENGSLEYTFPDMPNHPEQGYKVGR
jgi:hypothetical protein